MDLPSPHEVDLTGADTPDSQRHRLVARPIVLTHVVDRRLINRLVEAVPGLGEIAPVPTVAELVELAQSTPGVACVVLSVRDAHGAPVLPYIKEIRAALPFVPIVLVVRSGDEARVSIPAAVRGGVTHIIHSAVETRSSLRSLFAAILSFPVPREVLEVVSQRVPALARDVVGWCVQNGFRRITVPEMAQEFGLNRKTVFSRLKRSGLQGSSRIIAWSRLVHVATRLDRDVIPIARIARDMRFGTEATLRTFVRRETGFTATQLRRRGAVSVVIASAPAFLERPG